MNSAHNNTRDLILRQYKVSAGKKYHRLNPRREEDGGVCLAKFLVQINLVHGNYNHWKSVFCEHLYVNIFDNSLWCEKVKYISVHADLVLYESQD